LNRGSSDSGFLPEERDGHSNNPGHDSNFKEFSMALTDTAVRQAKATGTIIFTRRVFPVDIAAAKP
jgi:hypothetical protein